MVALLVYCSEIVRKNILVNKGTIVSRDKSNSYYYNKALHLEQPNTSIRGSYDESKQGTVDPYTPPAPLHHDTSRSLFYNSRVLFQQFLVEPKLRKCEQYFISPKKLFQGRSLPRRPWSVFALLPSKWSGNSITELWYAFPLK